MKETQPNFKAKSEHREIYHEGDNDMQPFEVVFVYKGQRSARHFECRASRPFKGLAKKCSRIVFQPSTRVSRAGSFSLQALWRANLNVAEPECGGVVRGVVSHDLVESNLTCSCLDTVYPPTRSPKVPHSDWQQRMEIDLRETDLFAHAQRLHALLRWFWPNNQGAEVGNSPLQGPRYFRSPL
jgi:hypothetical protein